LGWLHPLEIPEPQEQNEVEQRRETVREQDGYLNVKRREREGKRKG
jgi:hypothetical protein